MDFEHKHMNRKKKSSKNINFIVKIVCFWIPQYYWHCLLDRGPSIYFLDDLISGTDEKQDNCHGMTLVYWWVYFVNVFRGQCTDVKYATVSISSLDSSFSFIQCLNYLLKCYNVGDATPLLN